MKYAIKPSKRFVKDLKRCEKRGYDMRLIKEAMVLLAETGRFQPPTTLINYPVTM